MPVPMDYILDSSVFPTLPAGGSMSHADLMGRPRPTPTQIRPNNNRPPHTKPHNPLSDRGASSLDGHSHGHSTPGQSSSTTHHRVVPSRPSMALRRVSSFSGSVGNQAGIGAVGVGSGTSTPNLPARSLPARSGGRRGSLIGPERPIPVRRRSSYDEAKNVQAGVGAGVKGRFAFALAKPSVSGNRHQRTASESTGSTIKVSQPVISRGQGPGSGPGPPIPAKDKGGRSGSVDGGLGRSTSGSGNGDGSIRLGRPDQGLEIGRLINTLYDLTPPARSRPQTTPKSSSTSLHPALILTPLAIILEALVYERSILKTPEQAQSPPTLPTLKDGSSLQLLDGEVDWTSIRIYARSLGNVVDQILPFIQSSQDRAGVEDMIRSVRMFVGKIKKVFAEVVQGYGDGYGFLKGWWDDGDMKGCAGEIGRWCDLFDV